MAARELPTADTEGGSVLTDDYHPLDDLQRELFVAWRRNVQSVLQSTRTPDRRVTRDPARRVAPRAHPEARGLGEENAGAGVEHVMSTREEVEQAVRDYQSGTLTG